MTTAELCLCWYALACSVVVFLPTIGLIEAILKLVAQLGIGLYKAYSFGRKEDLDRDMEALLKMKGWPKPK